MLASELNGLAVYAAGMSMIGKVEDQMIDPQSYSVTDLIVKLRKDSARRIFGKRFLVRGARVRVPVSTIDKIGDGIILRFSLDKLEEHIQKI